MGKIAKEIEVEIKSNNVIDDVNDDEDVEKKTTTT